jgi:hypothetical protein
MHPDEEQLLTVSPLRARRPEPDEICAQAVDLARDAAVELAGPGHVGDHAGADADADRVVTHLFDCLDPAYRGWRWAITLARASRAKTPTVAETRHQCLFDSSAGLIAVFHALLRLLAPRHPPHALSSLAALIPTSPPLPPERGKTRHVSISAFQDHRRPPQSASGPE